MAITSLKSGISTRSGMVGNTLIYPGSYESIATVTVSTPVSSITFSSIPATYTHLQLRYFGGNTAAPNGSGFIYFNGDTTGTNYYDHALYSDGASATSTADANGNNLPYLLGDLNRWGVNITDILDYTNTNKYKVARSLGGHDGNGNGYVLLTSNLWKSTSAITSINIQTSQSFIQYSSFALYGIA